MHIPAATQLVILTAAAAIVPAANAPASGPHWCRQGDPPLYASARTGCGLAGGIVTGYVNVCREARRCEMTVQAPRSRVRYRISCLRTGPRHTGTVHCAGRAGTGVWTRFSAEI